MAETAVVGIEVSVHPAGLELQAQFGGEHILVAQVANEVVVHLRGCKRRACDGSFLLIADTAHECDALAHVQHGTELTTTVEEAGSLALSERVVEGKTVAHHAFALQRLTADAARQEVVQGSEVLGIGCPEVHAVHEDVVVVGKAVANLDFLVRVVGIVHGLHVAAKIGSDDVGVHVVERAGTEQVFHRLIVHALIGRQVEASVELLRLRELLVQRRGKADGQLVVVIGLQIVHGVAALC